MSKTKRFTWEYEGQFCSAAFVKASQKVRTCEGCREKLPIGSSYWSVFSPGLIYCVCEPCWDHQQTCDICREEGGSEWEYVAECRRSEEADTRLTVVAGDQS